MRLARALGGGIDCWLELPIHELVRYLLEVTQQVATENEAAQQAVKG